MENSSQLNRTEEASKPVLGLETDKLFLFLKVSCVCLFFGRGWQHFFWDAPFRSVLWNEGLLKGFVESFGISWFQYATSPYTDQAIQLLIKGFGAFYFFMGGFCLSLSLKKNITKQKIGLLKLGFISLFSLAIFSYISKFFYFGMLIEHALQFGAPLLLLIVMKRAEGGFFLSNRDIFIFKFLIALTFLGHGLFAIGFYPVPGHFVDMVISLLGLSEDSALIFLKIVGSLDILVAILLFMPRIDMPALVFTSFWGISTAMARVVANMSLDDLSQSSHQWIMETSFRLPHGLIPLGLLLVLYKTKKNRI